MKVTRFAIVIVNLDPTVGSEIKKTRPCVVISPDELNRHLRSVVVIPLTSQRKDYPTRVAVTTQRGKGYAVVEQIRTIDKARITKVAGKITRAEQEKLTEVIRSTYVD
ncbi:hypothetical protein LEM8419_02331 [Neolewinella maritima]|uniref:mRNA interferase n=1 Tax=Neolewinella maritima TaxID=1383882 RepID=A0ABM9B256_9BACT|nr:type II toxin-antitoxin system PemK/MazF family toxin [Neolewinella maritima]CAH1001428.1 hypothetical protein LEM8419_02331 [Neolewinella maritima]